MTLLNRIPLFVAALASCILISCAPSAKRLDKLSVGMTKSDAVKKIGKPESTTANDSGEVLTYSFTDKPFGDGMIFPGRYLIYIKNGRVVGWVRDEQKDALDRERAFKMNTMGMGQRSSVPGAVGGGVEAVGVIKVLNTDHKVIVRRKNGERYLLEHGVGIIGISLFEGREILINSPSSLFAGVGSSIILPGDGGTAKIWEASRL